MKVLISCLLALCLGHQTFAAQNKLTAKQIEAAQSVQRAATANIEMLRGEIARLKTSHQSKAKIGFARKCDDDVEQCVPNCAWRNASGTCLSYGSDFCAVGAQCAPHCTWRNAAGTCLSYDADFCGEDAACSPNCTWRNASGECLSYDGDICY